MSPLSYSQEKESTDVHKTKSSAIIGGVKYYLHTVEKGQTLFAIAKYYNRDVNDVVIENPDAIDGIKPGQVLRIPVEKKKPMVTAIDSTDFILHKVEKGQTLYSISKYYGVSDEKLRLMNPELKDGLKTGQILKIPSYKKKDPVVINNGKSDAIKANSTMISVPDINIITEAADRVIPIPMSFPGELKEEYNIAFFLPFHADEANQIEVEKVIRGDAQLPNKSNVALQFYEGALLAIDSLKKLNLKAKIFVYDVDEKDSTMIANLLKKPELKEMDLIIGPLYGSGFMPVARFAKENFIPIVSPFTQVNKILFNNPYVCKVSPSATLQIEKMAKFVVDSFQTQNIILVNNSNIKEAAFFNAFKATANLELIKAGHLPADSVKEAYGLSGVHALLSSVKTNIVILPSNNQSYVTDFISKLNSLHEKNKIILFGMQSWINYDNLDFEYLNNLYMHIPSNSYVEYSDTAIIKFIKQYRETYKTEPEMYAFQGYDVTTYFMTALQKFGSGFLNTLVENKFKGIESNFDFNRFPSDSGFENQYVQILKYKDYKLMKAN
ncbi:MAG: LysM peptidoglycan-binding domain-containing protein [Bacteroidota bacterium]|nr:LysM peptidoglycan-binding domain-containing protein [Bacteroidota bacterium]